MELSNVLLFCKQWREAPGTGSPSFQFLLQKCLSLFLWYLWNFWSYMSEISHWVNLAFPLSNTIVFISIGFTNWDLWSFSQGDLLQECSEQRSCKAWHVSLVHIVSLIFGPPKLNSVPFLEHIQELHLDLCSPIYCNSPQVSSFRDEFWKRLEP